MKRANEINPVSKDSDLQVYYPFNTDLMIGSIEYKLIRVPNHAHGYTGRICAAPNDFYCYARTEDKPTINNIYPYDGEITASWGIQYAEENRWYSLYNSQIRCDTEKTTIITRNGKPFCRFRGSNGMNEALALMPKIHEHPASFNAYKFDEMLIGSKIWYYDNPATIVTYYDGFAEVKIVPDGIREFKIPKALEHLNDPIMEESMKHSVRISLFSNYLCFYRNDENGDEGDD